MVLFRLLASSSRAAEYTDQISAEGYYIPNECPGVHAAGAMYMQTASLHKGKTPQTIIHDMILNNLMVLFTNPSARAGYDTRSIFKRSLTGFNSEFSFS